MHGGQEPCQKDARVSDVTCPTPEEQLLNLHLEMENDHAQGKRIGDQRKCLKSDDDHE
jgi:hypothetical protein